MFFNNPLNRFNSSSTTFINVSEKRIAEYTWKLCVVIKPCEADLRKRTNGKRKEKVRERI